jgi:pimeloyl-ACP methyl ester carboxylesterase
VPEALAVADHLGIDRFVTVGVSTGGAFALALAALAPDRVLAVVACCSVTDMRCRSCRATMSPRHALAVWDAADRDAAIAAEVEAHGEDGSRTLEPTAGGPHLAPSDLAMLADPEWFGDLLAEAPAMFAWGLQGYADDRIADGVGWVTFDAGLVDCPVLVVHGGDDIIVSVAHAEHTTRLVPGAMLRILPGLGHFSVVSEVPRAVTDLLARR